MTTVDLGKEGNNGLLKLAPDPSGLSKNKSVVLDTTINTEQLALRLTGKFAISAISLMTGNYFEGLIGIRFVVDGEEIWNSGINTISGPKSHQIFGSAFASINSNYADCQEFTFFCESSAELFVTSPEGPKNDSLTLRYNARPVK